MLISPDRRGTDSAKWTRHAQPGRDILPFWVADMDFVSPPAVVEALQARVGHGVFGYADASESCAEAVRAYLRTRHGVEVPAEWIVWLPGMVPGLAVASRAVGSPGDDVMIMTPVYPPFFSCPKAAERGLVLCPLAYDETERRYSIDEAALEAARTARTRLLILCNPHNPVGRVFQESELAAVRRFCARHDIVLCSDEIHCDLILDEDKPHRTAIPWEGQGGLRTITLHAPSKTYNIAGLGLSFAVIPDESLRQAFRRAQRGLVPDPNVLSYVAAEAAYRYGEPWRQELLAQLRLNRDRARQVLDARPGLRTHPVEATYLLWIDARSLEAADPHRFLLDRANVFLSPGTDFGAPGFLRFNFGCAPAVLEEGLGRMARAWG